MNPELIQTLATSMLAILIKQEKDKGPITVPDRPLTAKQKAAISLANISENKAALAKRLGVSRSTLYRWIEEKK